LHTKEKDSTSAKRSEPPTRGDERKQLQKTRTKRTTKMPLGAKTMKIMRKMRAREINAVPMAELLGSNELQQTR
jgi:hypothetical protein